MKRELAALAFAVLFPSASAYLYFDVLGGAGQGGAAVPIAYAASKVVQFAFPVFYLWMIGESIRVKNQTYRRDREKYLWMAIAFGLAVALGVVFLASVLSPTILAETPSRLKAKVAEFGVATPHRFVALAVFLCLMHSGLEEYYWRWFVHGRLRKMLPFAPAAMISSLGFMGHHVIVLHEYFPGRFWTATVPLSFSIALGGLVWAWLYERSGSLIGPWLSHLLVDVGIMAVGYRVLFIDAA